MGNLPTKTIILYNITIKRGNVTKATIKFADASRRRIILPKEIIEVEDLHEGDYIEIDVKKIERPKEKA